MGGETGRFEGIEFLTLTVLLLILRVPVQESVQYEGESATGGAPGMSRPWESERKDGPRYLRPCRSSLARRRSHIDRGHRGGWMWRGNLVKLSKTMHSGQRRTVQC